MKRQGLQLALAAQAASVVLWALLPQASFAGAQAVPPTGLELGKQVFTQRASPACAVCHALRDAGSEGAIGPALDELKPDAARVTKAVRNGIGVMPAFKDKLTDAEIEAVSSYVASASRSPP